MYLLPIIIFSVDVSHTTLTALNARYQVFRTIFTGLLQLCRDLMPVSTYLISKAGTVLSIKLLRMI